MCNLLTSRNLNTAVHLLHTNDNDKNNNYDNNTIIKITTISEFNNNNNNNIYLYGVISFYFQKKKTID